LNRTLVAVAAVLALLVGAGTAAAAPGSTPADAGPPDDLPDPVPDFVSELHGAISEFVSGSADRLGEALRSITPGGDAGPAAKG
jgi:hypothetical protein